MKWIDVDNNLPEIIETETHNNYTIEYSDYVVIYRVVLWLTSYHVARLKRVKFDDGDIEETWECSTGDSIFNAMTVYYWSKITPVESDSE